MKHIAIFASGSGSNAAKIIDHLRGNENMQVSLIVSNKTQAGVLTIAKQNDIPTLILERNNFYENPSFLKEIEAFSIDFIVLAGFLWLIPRYLVEAFPNKMVNIHPALLPKFGGKGMYGMHVHRAVKAAEEKESGPTIHFVNTQYDEGDIIFQISTPLNEKDSPEEIAAKVLKLEHHYYPLVVETIVSNLP